MINTIYITWIVYMNISQLYTYCYIWKVSNLIPTFHVTRLGCIDSTQVENHNLIVTLNELTND
jgi:hypothetical protein